MPVATNFMAGHFELSGEVYGGISLVGATVIL